MFVSLDMFVGAADTFLFTKYRSSESLTEAPDKVAPSLLQMEKLRNKLGKRPISKNRPIFKKKSSIFMFFRSWNTLDSFRTWTVDNVWVWGRKVI
jgi:hypothetical protein